MGTEHFYVPFAMHPRPDTASQTMLVLFKMKKTPKSPHFPHIVPRWRKRSFEISFFCVFCVFC